MKSYKPYTWNNLSKVINAMNSNYLTRLIKIQCSIIRFDLKSQGKSIILSQMDKFGERKASYQEGRGIALPQ